MPIVHVNQGKLTVTTRLKSDELFIGALVLFGLAVVAKAAEQAAKR